MVGITKIHIDFVGKIEFVSLVDIAMRNVKVTKEG